MTDSEKLDRILELLEDQKELQEERHEEILERFANLNSNGTDFRVDELEEG